MWTIAKSKGLNDATMGHIFHMPSNLQASAVAWNRRKLKRAMAVALSSIAAAKKGKVYAPDHVEHGPLDVDACPDILAINEPTDEAEAKGVWSTPPKLQLPPSPPIATTLLDGRQAFIASMVTLIEGLGAILPPRGQGSGEG